MLETNYVKRVKCSDSRLSRYEIIRRSFTTAEHTRKFDGTLKHALVTSKETVEQLGNETRNDTVKIQSRIFPCFIVSVFFLFLVEGNFDSVREKGNCERTKRPFKFCAKRAKNILKTLSRI